MCPLGILTLTGSLQACIYPDKKGGMHAEHQQVAHDYGKYQFNSLTFKHLDVTSNI